MARAGRDARRRRWPRRPAPSARRRSATRARSAATSAPRRRRATRCRCSSRWARPSSWRASPARAWCPIGEFLTGPKATALEPGELIVGVRVPVRRGPQEYLKVGVRNAMVIAVASVAMVVDRDARHGRRRARLGRTDRARPRPTRARGSPRSPTGTTTRVADEFAAACRRRRSPDRRPPQSRRRTVGTPSA